MTRPRLSACLLALALAVPSSAFAQGAGNDQYQDPFGDEPTQNDGGSGSGGDGGSGEGDGLSTTPPGGGSGTSGSGSSGSQGGTTGTTTPPPATTAPATSTGRQLPNTGSDPRVLALFGLALLLFGVGMRLRTIDPDAY